MVRSLALALILLVATPAAAADEAWWDDWSDAPGALRLWYRLKPSFPEQGPRVFVRFDIVGVPSDPDATPQPPPRSAWRATRTSLYLPAEDVGVSRTERQVADSESCPAILKVMAAAGPALSARFETNPLRKKPMLFDFDGIQVTVGGRGVFEPGSTRGSVTVSGNVNTAAADWAFEAEAALRSCWKAG